MSETPQFTPYTGKSEKSWREIKQWLAANPGKIAAVVTPDATYIVRIEPPAPFVQQEAITEWVTP